MNKVRKRLQVLYSERNELKKEVELKTIEIEKLMTELDKKEKGAFAARNAGR